MKRVIDNIWIGSLTMLMLVAVMSLHQHKDHLPLRNKLFLSTVPSVPENEFLLKHLHARKLPRQVQGVTLAKRSFDDLSGWDEAQLKPSFEAFQRSCRTFLHDNPDHRVGSSYLPMKVKDWHPVCQAAKKIDATSEEAIRQFFETWFTPVEFTRHQPVKGLFTGYYMPLLKASTERTSEY